MFRGEPGDSSATSFKNFGAWATRFRAPDEAQAGIEILKGAERIDDATPLDWHCHCLIYLDLIATRGRCDAESDEEAIAVCERLVRWAADAGAGLHQDLLAALVPHDSFDRLITHRNRQGDPVEAQRLEDLYRHIGMWGLNDRRVSRLLESAAPGML